MPRHARVDLLHPSADCILVQDDGARQPHPARQRRNPTASRNTAAPEIGLHSMSIDQLKANAHEQGRSMDQAENIDRKYRESIQKTPFMLNQVIC
jgi:hypothetical protein